MSRFEAQFENEYAEALVKLKSACYDSSLETDDEIHSEESDKSGIGQLLLAFVKKFIVKKNA